jgi:hypothetical protein
MFLFYSCNPAVTPHFHQFTVLDAEQTPSVSNPLPNNSLLPRLMEIHHQLKE